ncbi:unnamed protein product [Protopolystoma xenopodis]|uniref:Radial spoke head protein 3 homolog n=1 Tax=Protopolystoma xenopodis TaxID=117903 RepID=A0A448WRQ8_9PLAT|nr:unnamed protein product [Protopolystoma xenopodis]
MATLLSHQCPEGTYSFSSQPKVAPQRRNYQDKFKCHILPISAQPDPLELQRQAELRRRLIARRRAKEQLRSRTPPPMEGRQNQDVQTHLYLEELVRIEETEADSQTDAFLDIPEPPLFIPAKVGRDVSTQILDGELFDFDLEVVPILDVLVGKTIEQSLLEVMEEEELSDLRAQQNAFEEMRQAEMYEQQRLQEKDRRLREEKERRRQQQLATHKRRRELTQKIAAKAFATAYLADLVPNVFGQLSEHGYFSDPIEKDIEDGYLPWLMLAVNEELLLQAKARLVLDGMIREVNFALYLFQYFSTLISNEAQL